MYVKQVYSQRGLNVQKYILPLASPKVLSLENEKKSILSFCILLVYPYLCIPHDVE